MKEFFKRLFPSWHSISQRLKEIVLLFQTQKIYGNRSVKKNLQLISESEYFDAQWYLQQYQDIAQSQINPALHYLLHGGFEGRNPSNSFSSALYTKTHPEIIETRINPLIHFLRHKPNQNAKTPLYLHVGLHKTGTSAIQKFLRHHADCLQECGFYYPSDIYEGDAQHGLPSILRQSSNLEHLSQAQTWLTDCHRYCQAHHLSLLISSEVFSEPIRHDELERLLQSFDVTVIIYIRRQDLLIESILNQILKDRQDIRSDDFWMNFDSMYVVDFKNRIEQWRLIFPTGRVRVRRYGTSSQKRPIEEDFLQVLNINPTCTATWRSEKVNPSLSLYEFTILRRLVQKGLISSRAALEEARIKLAEKIAKHQVIDGAMVGNYFSPEIRQRILEKYARSNEEIRAEFFPEDQNLFEPLSPTIRLAIDSTMVTLLESEMINDLLKEQSQ